MRILLLLCLLLTLTTGSSWATDNTPPPMPGQMMVPTADLPDNGAAPLPLALDGELPADLYPLLRLTPDKIEVIKLPRDAVNVVVGNNKHLLAVMETSRKILLIPRSPGATHLQVLDASGQSIMQRSVIVVAPATDYIRVRRTCATKDSGTCQEYSVFYCPDMCHNVAVTQDVQQGNNLTVPAQAASGAAAPATTAPTAADPSQNDGLAPTESPAVNTGNLMVP